MRYLDEPEYPVMDDFSMNISTMIEEEVKRRAAETVGQLEQSRKYSQELAQKLYEANSKVRGYDQEKSKLLKEKENEVRRDMFDGFTIGDSVFYAKGKYSSHKCPKCSGTGKLEATLGEEKIFIKCLQKGCYEGKVSITTYSPQSDKIRSIHLELHANRKFLNCYLEREDEKREMSRLFKTMEECQTYCDEKNLPKATESSEIA